MVTQALLDALKFLKSFGVGIDIKRGRFIASSQTLSLPKIKPALEAIRNAGKEKAQEALDYFSGPHFLEDGTLVIPSTSPEKFRWWAGGQNIKETIKELTNDTKRSNK